MHGDRFPVQESALAATGAEHLAVVGIVDHADRRLTVDHHAYRDTPGMQPVQEAGGAVDRIDDPYAGGVIVGAAAFLAEKTVLGKPAIDHAADQRFDAAVGFADHVLQALFKLDGQTLPPLIKAEGEIGGGAGDLACKAVARLDVPWGK